MEAWWIALLLCGLSVRWSAAFPSAQHSQNALFQRPGLTLPEKQQQQQQTEAKEQVNTVSVTCHPDSLEIVIQADLFGVGAPVQSAELQLGVEDNVACRAAATSRDEYRIFVGLQDCGTQHWMTEEDLVYTNLLIFSPEASADGLIRMEEAVIPIECQYPRKYSLSSDSIAPTWIPFMSTQASVELLDFNLRIMTDDWLYQRSSNVFFLGEPVHLEASVTVGHHLGLRVFVSECVATLEADVDSQPRYVFVENGCLLDSQLPGSRSHFLPRTQDDKLQMVVDAFRFHGEERGELYITCHLMAVSVNDADAPNKACALTNGRWRSIDGNDFLCGHCPSDVGETKPSSPAKFTPRGFGKPVQLKPSWRSSLTRNSALEQATSVGPMMVLPAKYRSGLVAEEELPPVLKQIRPSLYGSQWRSGGNRRVDVPEEFSHPSEDDEQQEEEEDYDQEEEEEEEEDNVDVDHPETGSEEDEEAAPLEKFTPGVLLKSKDAALIGNVTAPPSGARPTTPAQRLVTESSNTTVEKSELSQPKR